MVAHSQFCMAGDNTLEAASIAIEHILDNSSTSSFANNLQQARSQLSAGSGSLGTFQFPQNRSHVPSSHHNVVTEEDEEDLYS